MSEILFFQHMGKKFPQPHLLLNRINIHNPKFDQWLSKLPLLSQLCPAVQYKDIHMDSCLLLLPLYQHHGPVCTHIHACTASAVVARRCVRYLSSLKPTIGGRGWWMLGGPSFINACLIPAHHRCPSQCHLIVNREGEKKQHASWPLGNWCHCFKLAGALWIWIE